jgi:hypothetical protein
MSSQHQGIISLNWRCGIIGIVLVGLFASNASALDICSQLSRLITDPPAGFVAARAEQTSPQRWASRPFLPNANCAVWASRSSEAHNIRCTINDGTNASKVAGFYQDTVQSIDRCLAALPDGKKYRRHTAQVDSDGLKGAETRWIYDSGVLRFQIDLADYRRTADRSTYNSLSVEYLKY